MDELEKDYEEYLEYMYDYEEEFDTYPMGLSNGQWTPYSFSEYKEVTEKSGKIILHGR